METRLRRFTAVGLLLTFIYLISTLTACQPQENNPMKDDSIKDRSDLHLRYQTSSETSYTDLDLRGSELIYTYFSDDDNRCAQWFKNSPCWTEADLKRRTIILSDAEISALLALIKASGCFELESDTFGESNMRTRSYTETLTVKLGKQERKLRYRSSLEAEAKPGAFAQLEQALREQIRQKNQ